MECAICGDIKHKKKLYLLLQKVLCSKKVLCGLKAREEGCSTKTGSLLEATDHLYYLCPNAEASRSSTVQRKSKGSTVGGSTERNYTEAQEEFFKKFSPELAQQCRDAFCNTVSRTSHVAKSHSSLLAEGGPMERPVIMTLLEVTANAGQKVGTLIDLASDTNYITHEAAGRLNLRREAITLVVHGVRGMKVFVETRRYLLRIRVSTRRAPSSPTGWFAMA